MILNLWFLIVKLHFWYEKTHRPWNDWLHPRRLAAVHQLQEPQADVKFLDGWDLAWGLLDDMDLNGIKMRDVMDIKNDMDLNSSS